MQVEIRSMFFQMKDNCSVSDRFEFEADIFSFIVLPICEGLPLAGGTQCSRRASRPKEIPRDRTAYKKMLGRRATDSGLSRFLCMAHPLPPKRCAPTQPRWSPAVAVVFCSAERRLTTQKQPTAPGMPQAARR
jgi:hypothetical protein